MIQHQKDIHEQLIVDIMRTSEVLDSRLGKLFKQFGLTQVQYNMMRILRGALPEPLSAGEIKARLIHSKSDVTRLIDRLVEKNIAQRTICEDNRRKVHITITNEGLEVLDELKPLLRDQLNGFYADLISAEEVDVVRNTLKRIQTSN